MDIAIATAKEIKANILTISEPNRSVIKGRKDWIHSQDQNTAIKILDSNVLVTNYGQGPGFTYVSTNGYAIYSCYCSGNNELTDLEETLDQIGQLIRRRKEEAVITGDFNAKSPQWGMSTTDERGTILVEWLAENSLLVANQGEKPTFQVQNYGSILDLTITTENLRGKISEWKVLDTETLSDHNYITFCINEMSTLSMQNPRPVGWEVKKLDKKKLDLILNSLEPENSEEQSGSTFTEELLKICEKVMPKRILRGNRQPMYWWNDEIAELRRDCLSWRRKYTRSRRNQTLPDANTWENYKELKKKLRIAIRKSKSNCWKAICDQVDGDIWGDGYKIVTKSILGFPQRINLTIQRMEEVAKHLFPIHEPVIFNCDTRPNFKIFTLDELLAASKKLKTGKAPGPNNIPTEIIKTTVDKRPEYVLDVYNNLATRGKFPDEWKRAKLLLLPKGNKPMENPSSFRPICLLDIEGKLYEQMLLERLKAELTRTGGLSPRQYGFQKGRQTVDAINEVLKIAREAENYSFANRRLCAVITLDVKNAFNSASWQIILDELRSRQIDETLIRIIYSYLSDRFIILDDGTSSKALAVNSGVPQGSVLGPTLWNIMYDELLNIEMPKEAILIGFADDVALVTKAQTEAILMNKTNTALLKISKWMGRKRLTLAAEKTESILLTKKRKVQPVAFTIQGTTVRPKNSTKYLGVYLDTKMSFANHIEKVVEKTEKTVTALSSLMPNVGGPRATKRRVLASVAHSQILYGAPAWHEASKNKSLMTKLKRVQRTLCIRVCSAYRTISTQGVGVISEIPPINLQIEERRNRYLGTPKQTAREHLVTQWQEEWDRGTYGRWTHYLIPNIESWMKRPYGDTDYFLTQALSGHGCFNKYLYERKKSNTSSCIYCPAEDDANHTLFECIKWLTARETYRQKTGRPFTAENMMDSLVKSEVDWNHAYEAVRKIIETKEKELRVPR